MKASLFRTLFFLFFPLLSFAQLPNPVVTYSCGPSPGEVCFNAYDSTWLPNTHNWDFGDGSPLDTGFNTCHIYTFPASYAAVLTITNVNGTVTDTVYINLDANGDCYGPPQANFYFQMVGCIGDSIMFYDQSAFIPTTWNWSFPGGSPSSSALQYPVVQFPTQGVFPITLIVSNAYGADTITQNLTINSCPPSPQPMDSCVGNPGEVFFLDSLGYNCSQNCVWAWDFGDGSPIDNSMNPVHTYLVYPATYTVTLTVSNPSGTATSTCLVVLDAAGNCGNLVLPPPIADIGFTCNGAGWIQFADSSLNNPTQWSWSFGDGSPGSTLQNPLHQYTVYPATYAVILYVANQYGSSWVMQNIALDAAGNCINLNTVNVISGNRYHDFNRDCMRDSAEYGLPNRLMQATPGPYYSFTNSNGDYILYVDTGSYAITEVPYTGWGQFCPPFPTGYNEMFWGYGGYSIFNDFGDTISQNCPDLRLDMTTWTTVPCLSSTTYLHYQNYGTQPVSGVLMTATFDPLLTLTSSSPPWSSINGNTATWNLGILSPGQMGYVYVNHNLSCSAQVGNFLTFTGNLAPSIGDCEPTDNTSAEYAMIRNSWDPNDKWVKARNFPQDGYVQNDTILNTDKLEYIINFQNTGTSPAINIILTDTIDAALDVSSVQPLMSSHPYTNFSISGSNVIQWVFNGINLPDSGTSQSASRGFVKFRISQLPGNPDGTNILNRAGIFFDNNPAVLTNYTVNVIDQSVGMQEWDEAGGLISIFPIPSSGLIHLACPLSKVDSWEVSDITGKVVMASSGSVSFALPETLDISGLSAGMYFIRASAGVSMMAGKFIRE